MSYESEFKDRLDGLLKRAKDSGVSLSKLCDDVGLARSTPDRWRKEVPKTIRSISELELALERRQQAQAAQTT